MEGWVLPKDWVREYVVEGLGKNTRKGSLPVGVVVRASSTCNSTRTGAWIAWPDRSSGLLGLALGLGNPTWPKTRSS